MFDGDQLHQFMASSRAANSLPNSIPLPFPLHGNPSFSAAFDPNYGHLHRQEPPFSAAFDPNYGHLHRQEPHPAAAKLVEKHPLISATNSGLESERSVGLWSNDEVLALLKLRSSMEIWFPDFTWEHVSRKLTELGYKRSPDECKDKFEDESRHFNQSKIFSELDELYTSDHRHDEARFSGRNAEKVIEVDQEKEHVDNKQSRGEEKKVSKKRKRRDKFEKLKGLCEDVVKKMIAHQEEMHNKMIDDMLKRDEEKMKREEAWKNEEMIRVRKEMEIRSKEQASAAERQGTIIQFLKKFTCDDNNNDHDQEYQTLKNKIDDLVNKKDQVIINSSDITLDPNPLPVQPSNSNTLVVTVPTSSESLEFSMKSDIGKRWPRDEVLALINLRCRMSGNNDEQTKGPLWERISQGMMELGYKRNAKRCKEKWENINKYFRKTKDSNKKRSVNSRTCPYFHQLSSLYAEGTLTPEAPTE